MTTIKIFDLTEGRKEFLLSEIKMERPVYIPQINESVRFRSGGGTSSSYRVMRVESTYNGDQIEEVRIEVCKEVE